MTTNFSLSDSLSKDAGGAKMMNWVDLSTSQLDLSLPGGIGSKTTGSKITTALWSGNGLAGCKVEPTGGVGNMLMAHFASNASATATQNGIHLRGDDRGQVYQSALSMTASAMSGSTETVTLASGLLYRAIVAGCGVVAAGQLAILNGGTSLAHLVFSGANEQLPTIDFGAGACFASLRWERRNTVGTVYVTSIYRNFGQG